MKSIPCALAIFVLFSGSAGAGQHDEHVRLVLNVNAIGLPFEDPAPRQHRAVFYVGEAVVATVTLINSTADDIEIEEPWMQRLVFRLRPSNGGGSEVPLPFPEQATSGTTKLAGGRKLEITRQVAFGGRPLPPGLYELEATLAPGVIRNRPVKANDALIASLTVEVRTVTNRTDELNALFHAAVSARWAGNTRRAKEFLTELLNRAPNSPIAHAEQGAVLAAEHDCTGAKQAYERAIALAQSGAASEDSILKNARAVREWVEVGLPEAIRNCR